MRCTGEKLFASLIQPIRRATGLGTWEPIDSALGSTAAGTDAKTSVFIERTVITVPR